MARLSRPTLAFATVIFLLSPVMATPRKDDRVQRVVPVGAAYSPIGVLFITRAQYVTAFLVNDCEVLSVRHVIADRVGKRVTYSVGQIGNSDAWRRGTWRETGGTVVAVGENFSHGDKRDVGYGDWALVRLDKCLGRQFGHVELQHTPPDPSVAYAVLGFPQDKLLTRGATLVPSCRLTSVERRQIGHDCAVALGNSGSPIFLADSVKRKRLIVVAINTGGVPTPGQTLLRWGRAVPVSQVPPPSIEAGKLAVQTLTFR